MSQVLNSCTSGRLLSSPPHGDPPADAACPPPLDGLLLWGPPPLLPPPPAEAAHKNPRMAKPGADRTAGAVVRQPSRGSVGVKRTGISS